MAYDPTAPTEGERNIAYYIVGIGAVANAVLLFAQVVTLPRWIAGGCLLAVAVSLLGAVFSSRNDDYFRHLSYTASRFAMGIIALWLCLAATIHLGDGGQFFGELAAGARPTENVSPGPAAWFKADTLAVIVAMAFHIGFFFERYRR